MTTEEKPTTVMMDEADPANATHVVLPASVWAQVIEVVSQRPYQEVGALFDLLKRSIAHYRATPPQEE